MSQSDYYSQNSDGLKDRCPTLLNSSSKPRWMPMKR